MKRLFFILLLILAFASTGFCGTTGSSLSKGLIAHWPLTDQYEDGTYGAKDATPGGNHGAAEGGVAAGATSTPFDGNLDAIAVTSTTFDVDGADYTFSFWAKRTSTAGTNYLLGNNLDAGNNHIRFNDNLINIESNTNTNVAHATLVTSDTNWHHIVVSISSGTVTAYQNEVVLSITGDALSDDLVIDRLGEGNTLNFSGNLADFRIYDRVLSADEISLLYSQGMGAGATAHDIGTNLTGHYPLTSNYVDGSGFPTDIGSDGNDATALSGAVVGTNGTVFDGVNDYITIPSNVLDVDGSDVSFSFWLQRNATDEHMQIVSKNGSVYVSCLRVASNNVIYIESDLNNDLSYSSQLTADTGWHFFVISISSGTVVFYEDASVLTTTGDVNGGNLTIDTISYDNTDYAINGTLSNLRIYEDRALTQTDVDFLYAQGRHGVRTTGSSLNKGLIGSWELDSEYTDATYDAKDSTPYSNHGTGTALTVGATYTEFNGTTSKVDLGGNVVGDGDITWSGWIYPQGGGENDFETLYNNGRFIVVWRDANDIMYVYSDGATPVLSGAAAINTWHHVLITRDTTGANTNIYINGVLSGSANQDSGTPAAGTTNGIIGNRNASDRTFDGYIAKVKVWDRLLTAAEIALDYNLNKETYQ